MKHNDFIYLYDGSLEGLLTMFYEVEKEKSIPINIFSEETYVHNLLDKTRYIETDYIKSEEVINKINKISDIIFYYVYTAFLSSNNKKELAIIYYLINAFKYGSKINNLRTLHCVTEIENMVKRVRRESHRMKGFIRFKELNKGLLYAEIEPDNNVLEIIANHFSKRLKNEKFIINDLKRKKALIYNSKDYIIMDSTNINANLVNISNTEHYYEQMWKLFFNTVSIKERYNPKCQRNFMPKKYWKHILEVEES